MGSDWCDVTRYIGYGSTGRGMRKMVTHTSDVQLLDNVVHEPRHRALSG